ncbi:hypothetical protein [Nonomuraea gerenzanensis]|uniref:Uncharacterized protein n=1 Tax=Nonomuraea gerenzanensis TaxID=93944 RepID=A0A1M4EI14_9ACTN|nr:hypothetical protein [Nonomuraea gerenzanensis]UBU09986.1 hypothetical protein LCN96_37295 [Nonomuraea gerenzanensis]SBO98440.1 hypothetical protein BN4615_P7956 [Nonomuraea gerenzanensis]
MGYPQQPQDPYGQQPYGQSGPQQPYLPQPYSQPYIPTPVPPQYGPVQYTRVREFNPVAAVVHVLLWIFVHSWLCLFTLGLWLLIAIPVTFIGWKVTKHMPVQQVHYQQPPYPPY